MEKQQNYWYGEMQDVHTGLQACKSVYKRVHQCTHVQGCMILVWSLASTSHYLCPCLQTHIGYIVPTCFWY